MPIYANHSIIGQLTNVEKNKQNFILFKRHLPDLFVITRGQFANISTVRNVHLLGDSPAPTWRHHDGKVFPDLGCLLRILYGSSYEIHR